MLFFSRRLARRSVKGKKKNLLHLPGAMPGGFHHLLCRSPGLFIVGLTQLRKAGILQLLKCKLCLYRFLRAGSRYRTD